MSRTTIASGLTRGCLTNDGGAHWRAVCDGCTDTAVFKRETTTDDCEEAASYLFHSGWRCIRSRWMCCHCAADLAVIADRCLFLLRGANAKKLEAALAAYDACFHGDEEVMADGQLN